MFLHVHRLWWFRLRHFSRTGQRSSLLRVCRSAWFLSVVFVAFASCISDGVAEPASVALSKASAVSIMQSWLHPFANDAGTKSKVSRSASTLVALQLFAAFSFL